MVQKFIKYYLGLFSYYWDLFTFAIAGAWGFSQLVAAIATVMGSCVAYKHPEWGSIVNNLLWMSPLVIFIVLFVIRLILAPYEKHKQQQAEIDDLQKQSFFEKNINATVKGLEGNIKKIDIWLEDIKKQQEFPLKKLRSIISNEILFSFISTNTPGVQSIEDCFLKILRFLVDIKPNLGNDIKSKYDNIKQKIIGITSACPEDSDLPAEQGKRIAIFCVITAELKRIMRELSIALLDCVEIIKEDKL